MKYYLIFTDNIVKISWKRKPGTDFKKFTGGRTKRRTDGRRTKRDQKRLLELSSELKKENRDRPVADITMKIY